MVKLLAAEQGKMPSSEGVPVFLRADELPKTDQVVSYVLQLKHLDAEEASQAFSQIIPLHPYGSIGVVPNSRSLVITENSNTILAYVALAQSGRPSPQRDESTRPSTSSVRMCLSVTEQLILLMGLDGDSSGMGVSGAYNKRPVSRHPARPGGRFGRTWLQTPHLTIPSRTPRGTPPRPAW